MVCGTISHYEIVGKLGEGGMGVVYKAIDKRLGRPVALKMVNARFTQRFEREARAIAALNHPHICTLHDVGEHEGLPFLVMEYVDGRPLRGPLPSREVLDYAIQVCEALAAAHNAGIVHCDLKPDNLLLTAEGNIKVLDFGLAKLQPRLAPDDPTLTMTGPGVVAGTAPYMSPEQARGEPVDARSDIFSLGVVLYELLSGRRAFGRETMGATLAAVIAVEPPPLPEAPPEIARIVRKMLAKKRESRYQNTGELLADLKAAAQPRPVSRRPYLTLAAALAMLALLVTGLSTKFLRRPMMTQARAVRLAVLPFANLSGDPEQEFLSDGLTQEMIAQLGRLQPGRLSIIARTSVMRYKKSDKAVDQVGRELGVDYILEGSARRQAGRVRITAELIEVRGQTQLWSESYENDLADVLALQSEVSQKVAASLALKLLPAEQVRSRRVRAVKPEAYEAYLKGLSLLYRGTRGDLQGALEYFALALAKDPIYASAYTGVAMVWVSRQQLGYAPPHQAGPQAKAAALKALELDDSISEGHYALAVIKAWTDWDTGGAEREFTRAIEINPSFPDARAFYSHLLMNLQRPREAMPQMELALQLDPFNPLFQSLYAVDLDYVRRYDDAIAQGRKAVAAVPDHSLANWALWVAYSQKGMRKEALISAKAAMGLYADPGVQQAFDRGNAQGGYRSAMRLAAEELARHFRRSYANPTDIAALYLEAGEKTKTLEWLEKAFAWRDPNLLYIGMPCWDRLRPDPRFQALYRRINLPANP